MFCFPKKQYASGQHEVEIDEKGLETALFEHEFIERISAGEMGLAGNRICMSNYSFASTCHLVNFDQVVFVSYPLGQFFFQRLSFLLSKSFMQVDKPHIVCSYYVFQSFGYIFYLDVFIESHLPTRLFSKIQIFASDIGQ